jgi:hypothetical protein
MRHVEKALSAEQDLPFLKKNFLKMRDVEFIFFGIKVLTVLQNMALTMSFPLLLISLAIVLYLSSLFSRWKSPLSRVPGPEMASWSRLWLIKSLFSGIGDYYLVRLNNKHGMFGPIERFIYRVCLI